MDYGFEPTNTPRTDRLLEICQVSLRLRLFRLNLISGNQFPENRAFGCAGKFGQTEIIFSLTGKYAKND